MKKIENNHNGIFYLQADVNYTIIYYCDGSKVVSSFTLKKYEQKEELRAFLRVNKSFLLNPEYISNYEQIGKQAIVELANGRKVNVSRRKIGLIKEFLNPNN
jgi:DNA-binding LytR/AlgR family response regulator